MRNAGKRKNNKFWQIKNRLGLFKAKNLIHFHDWNIL